MRHTRTARILVPVLIAISLGLVGCSAAGSSSGSSSLSDGVAPAPAIGTTDSSKSGGSATDSTVTDAAARQVVQTGYATVVVTKPLDAATQAIAITDGAGGRVDGRTENAPTNGDSGSATLTLRIPSAALDTTLEKLKALGRVQEVSLSAADVTMQSQDLNARITALSASIDRLLALLSTATDTNALITLEGAISDRQGQLESLQAEQRYLADQVSMATLTLNLISDAQATPTQPGTFLSGLALGWQAFLNFFTGLLVVLGVLLPWLLLAAVITAVTLGAVRLAKRR
jgi:hypothetical protein